MKIAIFVLVTVLAPLFAHADDAVGTSTMKLTDENVAVNAAVARKEVQAIDADIRSINDEINQIELTQISMEALTQVGFPSNMPSGFAVISTGLKIERAQLMEERRAMLSEATVASK